MAFRLRADDGPTLIAGLVAAIFSTPGPVLLVILYFCDFSGGGGPDSLPPPLGSAHARDIHEVLKSETIFFCIQVGHYKA